MPIRVKIYVRSTGNDETGDGTSGAPFLTVSRALRVPPVFDESGDLRYVIDNTGCTEASPVKFPAFQSGQGLEFPATGIDFAPYYIEGYVTIQSVPTSLDTLNAATTSYAYDSLSTLAKVTDTSKSWTVDQYKGKFLVGSGSGEIAAIAGNTADTLDTAAYFAFTAPLSIVEPSGAMNGGVILSGVGANIVLNGQHMVMSGSDDRSLTMLGCDGVYAVMADVQNPDSRQNQNISISGYVHGNGGSITGLVCDAQSYTLAGYVKDCVPDTTGLNFNAFGIIVENTALLDTGLFGVTAWCQISIAEWRGKPFRYRGGNGMTVQNLKVSNVTGDGIIADGPGALELAANVGVDTASVSGIGLVATNAAQVKISNPSSVQPVGGSGALKVGSNATLMTWGPFTGNEYDPTHGAVRVFT